MEFSGKYALIVGAGSGIGRGTALLMARRGLAGITLADINFESVEETARLIEEDSNCISIPIRCDVLHVSDIESTVLQSYENFKRIDILVDCAGVSPYTQWGEEDANHWDNVMNINLRAIHLFIREVLKYMIPQHYGKIVNISSIAARVGTTVASVSYAASKAGILGLSKSYAKILGPHNITVNTILPGVTETPMTQSVDYSGAVKSYPMRRLGSVTDQAEAICFLASDKSSWITGAALDVNGGSWV